MASAVIMFAWSDCFNRKVSVRVIIPPPDYGEQSGGAQATRTSAVKDSSNPRSVFER
jgi:hypothetical protein